MVGTKNILFVNFIGENLANAGIKCSLAYNPDEDKAAIKLPNNIEAQIRLQVEIENAVRCKETKKLQRAIANSVAKTQSVN